MKRTILSLTILSALAAAWCCAANDPHARKVARGKYLVENVGLCADCHTPRNERGELVQANALQGSTLGFAPTVPMPAWANAAPAIAGLSSLSEEDAVKFLETGIKPNGQSPRPPMPPFRFSHEDAEAVAAYLKSLR